ncbi:MAG: glycoside hydrolase family 3 protein [Oscillospiraceae bacterium]
MIHNNRMATSDPLPSTREKANRETSTRIAEEGIVLLENKGVLPFDSGVRTIALYGSGARHTIKGGTGSGDVNVRDYVTVEQGLLNSGYSVVTGEVLAEYDGILQNARLIYDASVRERAKAGAFAGLIAMMSNPFIPPVFPGLTEEVLCRHPADAAVYVLSRNSGEGADRRAVPGDYYLSEQEISDITLLAGQYQKFALLLNVGGVVELSPVKDLPGAIVLMGQGGSGCGDAAAAVLSGRETPSGRLTATWAEQYADYPFAAEFGDKYDSYYKEGVFVGYRWFDSLGKDVLYPFGYGLSYTAFTLSIQGTELSGHRVSVRVAVKNTGVRPGKEVVQLYAAPKSPGLEKPYQSLVAFKKTKLLQPGEEQTLTLNFDAELFAVYHEQRAVWLIEQGEYCLLCGTDSRTTTPCAVVSLPESILLQQCENKLRGERIEEIGSTRYFTFPEQLPVLRLDPGAFCPVKHDYTQRSAADVEGLTDRELATLCIGAARIDLSAVTVVGTFSEGLPGAAGETTSLLTEKGVPSITMVDGPAGVRVNPILHEKNGGYLSDPREDPIFSKLITADTAPVDLSGSVTRYQYCTALPVASMLAQSWNPELLYQAGELIAAEMELLGVDIWLAPAMNIQRNPLCGRNFEYFSEDPLLTGVCAAALTNGVQSRPGKCVSIKHFAANNQETNRNFHNVHVSERTLREIYLRGYEICLKNSKPATVMTALNLINGVHTACDHDLLTDILRREWGFNGIVMTDWGTTGVPGSNQGQKYDCCYASDCIRAGNDLIMPGSKRDLDYLLADLENGKLDPEDVRRCGGNILKLLREIESEGRNGTVCTENQRPE